MRSTRRWMTADRAECGLGRMTNMEKIDFRKMDAVVQSLNDEAACADGMRALLEQAVDSGGRWNRQGGSRDGTLDEGDFGECIRASFEDVVEAIEILGQEAAALKCASVSIQKMILIYRQAEKRIIDIYNGECRIVPRTKFGTSRFENLGTFKELMPIHAQGVDGQARNYVKEAFAFEQDLTGIL